MGGSNWLRVIIDQPRQNNVVSGDCVSVIDNRDSLIAVLTDTAGSGPPASLFHNQLRSKWNPFLGSSPNIGELVDTLYQEDRRLLLRNSGIETTAVILVVKPSGIIGASVGDSAALLLRANGTFTDLTAGQLRKPLLGSGRCRISFFDQPPLELHDRLLICSDGLHKYAKRSQIIKLLTEQQEINRAANELVELARLKKSGNFQDDLSLILIATT